MPPRKKQKRPSRALAAFRFIFSNLFGIGFALLVFLALPLLQAIIEGGKGELVVRDTVAPPPPPPPLVEDEPPPPDDAEPEEPPPPPEASEPLSFDALAGGLDLGNTGGVSASLGSALSGAAASRAGEAMATSANDTQPRPVTQIAPKYPAQARKLGLKGLVKIEAMVDTSGRVQNPRIVSSPNPIFNAPAIDAAKRWRFEPGVRGGKKAPMKVRIPFRF